MNSNGVANLKVIDIYHGDGTVDFASLKNQGCDGVIIKATQGTTFNDNMLRTNYNNARAAGLKTGFYHFYNISNYDGATQAAFFLSAISGLTSDYLPAMDVEMADGQDTVPNPAALSSAVKTALDAVAAKTGGSMLYSNPVTLRQLSAATLGSYPLWIAEFNSSSVQDVPGFGPWTGWQYTTVPYDTSRFTSNVYLQAAPPDTTPIVIQNKLIRLRIGAVQPTGAMNPVTVAAIQLFQRTQKLTVDGIWGPKTEAAYQAVIAKPTLKQGSAGGPVGYVQFVAVSPVDLAFGSNTKNAVMQYQQQNGLTADGVVGANTWASLIG